MRMMLDFSKKMVLFLLVIVLSGAQLTAQKVTGRVTDDTGQPVPGVNVIVKGTTTGVITDFGGVFSITPRNLKTDILVFSFLGMKSQEIPVNGQNGNGKGTMAEQYTFRVWPKAYLDLLTDDKGIPLDATTKAAYQNHGY